MKRNIIVLSIGLLGFTFNLNAQSKTAKPVLSTSGTAKLNAKKVTVNKKNVAPQLKAKSSKTSKIVKGEKPDSKKNSTAGTPQLGTMKKKEEK